MAQFDELQTLWQTQSAPPAPPVDPAALAGAFRRYGRKQDTINILKSILVGGAIVQSVVAYRREPLMLGATLVILVCAAIALVAEWRIQRSIAQLNFSAPSVDFVRGA